MRQGPQPMMSRGFRAVSVRLTGKVYETRITEPHGIRGLEGLVGIAGWQIGWPLTMPVGLARFAISRPAAAV